jgi:peptidoglycan/LPS O-acetylase OafA/YrhL
MMSTPSAKTNFRLDINGLRCFAVLAVMFFHVGVPGFSGGYIGVDVFFVISGYLMTQLIVKGLVGDRFSVLEFYAARARRIIPGLVGLVVPLILLGYFCLIPRDYRGLARDGLSALGFFSNFLFTWQNNYFDNSSRENWLLHTWSLSVEWQFYLAYPIVLLAGWRVGRERSLPWGVAGLGVASLLASVLFTPDHPTGAFFLLPTRAWEMLSGGLVFLWASKATPRPWLGFTGLAVILAANYLFSEALYFPGYWALVPAGGAAAVIAANSQSRVLANRVAQFFGDISYSLYLWHWPVVVAARYFNVAPTVQVIVMQIALSIALGYLSYRYIETPFRRVGRGFSAPAYLGGCALAILPVAILGSFVFLLKGLPSRMAPNVARIVLANQVKMDAWNFPPECDNYRRRISKDSPPVICHLGAASSSKVLVWGDSLMEQLYGVFEDLEAPNGPSKEEILFATDAGCIPVRGIERAIAGYDCANFADAAYARALQPDISTVLIGGFWIRYLGSPSDGTLPTICDVHARCQHFKSSADALNFMSDQLSRDVRNLKAQGKRVVIVLPFPSYERPIASTLARQTFWNRQQPTDDSFAGPVDRIDWISTALRQVASATGAELLDPTAAICGSGKCPVERDGIALYRDASHLTREGARALKPLFEPVVTTVLPQ